MFAALKLPFRKKQATEEPREIEETTESPITRKMDSVPRMGEKYPGVKHLAVNLVISPPDHETEPTMNGRSFGDSSLAFFEFRCKNVECYEGGFNINDTIDEAIKMGETEVTGRRVCRGWHGKHRVQQLRCHYELNFKVNISYKKL